MKKVIVACGSGIALSQMVAFQVRKKLKERQIDVEVKAIAIQDLEEHVASSVAYLSLIHSDKQYNIPVLDGRVFLTGKGEEQELNRLIEIIKRA